MKNHIRELIEKRNIKRIVYVDNEFEIDIYKESIKLYLRENISDTSIEWPFPIEAGIEYAMEACNQWLDDNSNNDCISQFIKERKIKRGTHEIEKILNDILPPEILHCITPSEFKEQYIDNPIYTPTETEQMVVLMDKYLDEDDANSGMRLLSPFKNKEYVACGLFSNKFQIHDEINNWNDCDNAKNIYPLSKHRVAEDGKDFLLGLRNVVWLRQISDIKGQILDLYNNAFENTRKDLDSLDPASFDWAIIKSSAHEGCWEFDMMKRIMQLLLNRHVEKLMTEGKDFHRIQELTQILKKISDFPQCEDTPNSELLKDYYKSEVYADISYVNNTYSQIANGDIFEIEGKGEYMLCCQPCNLELRKDASRKSSEFVYLLPIEKTFILTEDNLEQRKKQNKQLYRSLLHQLSNEESMCVNLATNVRINPRILDLVSYNKEGLAVIDINKDKEHINDSHIMQANMLTHYHKIYSTICNQVKLCRKIASLPKDALERGEKQSLLKMLKKPFEMASEKLITVDCNPDTGIINFNIKRIGRYKEPFSQIVLNDFMNYLSRQALPNDFSKMIK